MLDPGDDSSSGKEDDEGTVAFFRRKARSPVWEAGNVAAQLTVLEAAYILLQQKREVRVRNNYFER